MPHPPHLPRPDPGDRAELAPAEEDEIVVMGQILGPYGIKGWIKIRPFTDEVDGLLRYRRWFVDERERPGQWRRMQPGEGHGHGTVLVARLEQIDDRTQAEQLTGARVAVARKELPAPAPGEFYWSDLVGLSVINEQGITLGAVQEVLDTGAHAVLRVVGECERLIPFVDAYVRDVDAAGRAIRVDWQPDY